MKIFGTKIIINPFMIVLIVLICLLGNPLNLLTSVALLLLHELGHCTAAYFCGQSITSIEFMPFGGTGVCEGVAKLSMMKEVYIAISGPLVNLVIGLVLIAINYFFPSLFLRTQYAIEMTYTLLIINLLPAYPLDGGRILAAVLGGKRNGKKIVLMLGKIIAVLLLAVVVFAAVNGVYNLSLLIISGFLIYVSFSERKRNAYSVIKNFDDKKKRMWNGQTLFVNTIAVNKRTSIRKVFSMLSTGKYNVINVLDDDMNLLYTVNEHDIITYMQRSGTGTMQSIKQK